MKHPLKHVRQAMLMRASSALSEAVLCLRVGGREGLAKHVEETIHRVAIALADEGVDGDHQKNTEWPMWLHPEAHEFTEGGSGDLVDMLRDRAAAIAKGEGKGDE